MKDSVKYPVKYPRTLASAVKESKKSVLLLGPRQTGKSTLIEGLQPDLKINLAREVTFLEYASRPDQLERVLAAHPEVKSVFIDEVQRIPSLLNTIQAILDETRGKYRFLLTGSSARKLRRGRANLLPGRVHTFTLSPLTLLEAGFDKPLEEAMSTGLLPGVYSERDLTEKKRLLGSYAATYLKEEIQAEALTKNIEGFGRFLRIAAAKNGEFVDFAKLGAQAAITQKTASRFFEILEDTLIIRRIDAYAKSDLRRLVKHPRYYFFDTGVLNGLLGNYKVSDDRIGMLFETLMVNQIHDLAASLDAPVRFSTYRTEGGAEVDLIVEFEDRCFAVEFKASRRVGQQDLRGLKSFSEIVSGECEKFAVYQGSERQVMDGVTVLPVREAMERFARFFSV